MVSLSAKVCFLPPFWVFPGWWWCGKRQRGWLSWIILVKKYHFSEQLFCCCWRAQTFLVHFLGQQCRTTEWCCGRNLYIGLMASVLISTSSGLLLFCNFWSSLQGLLFVFCYLLFVLCALKKHSFFPAWEEETIWCGPFSVSPEMSWETVREVRG